MPAISSEQTVIAIEHPELSPEEIRRQLRAMGYTVSLTSADLARAGRKGHWSGIRRRLEELIFHLAMHVIPLPAERIDREIEKALLQLTGLFRVDHSTLFRFPGRPRPLEPLHAHASAGADPMAGLDTEAVLPWCWQKWRHGEVTRIPARGKPPGGAAMDLENLRRRGVRSLAGVPIRIGPDRLCLLTLTGFRPACPWNPDLIRPLQLMGQLLGTAVFRKETESDLAELTAEQDECRRAWFRRDPTLAMGALTAAIAHEVHQPMAAILANAQAALQLLARTPPDLEQIRQILIDIVSDDKRAGDVIYSLRRMLQQDGRRYEAVDLNLLAAKAVSVTAGEAALRRITVATDLAASLPRVCADPVLLQQVLYNLMANAMEAMTRYGKKPARIVIETRMENTGWVEVHVCDTGPGIPQALQRASFQPFHTFNPDGLGLGLFLCRQIIEAHGGKLFARNRSQGGGRVSFCLPAAPPGTHA